MKRGLNMKRKLFILALVLGLLISLFTLPSFAAEEGEGETFPYYGRAALSECENSTALLYAYDAISAGVESFESEISIYNGTDALTQTELDAVVDAYRRDRAEHFWLGNEYQIVATDGIPTVIKPTYLFEGAALNAARAAVEYEVSAILSAVNDEWTDFEKLVYLHDTLAGRIEYTDGENAHSLYGALVLGKCVCEGYAESLQYLLHRLGIEAFLAIGKSVNPDTGTEEGHEWSYVKLDGEWCHVDLTWNDQGESLYHAYFGLTDAEIKLDHIIGETAYLLPECTSAANNYFALKGGVMNAPYDADAIADVLLAGGKSGTFYVDDAAAFVQFVDDNIYEIAEKCGVTSAFTRSVSSMLNEVKLSIKITECPHNSISPVAEKEASCTSDGVRAHFACDDCGEAFEDALGQNPVSNSELEIPALSHSYTEKIETDDYIKEKGTCKQKITYWYACEHCERPASLDPSALDKFYEGEGVGEHTFSDKWTSLDGEHWRGCTQSGCQAKTEVGEHIFEADVYSHKEKDGHAHLCTVCGDHDELTPHVTEDGAEPTETEPVRCVDCGYKVIPPLNHTSHTPEEAWSYNETAHWHECVGCEEEQIDYRIHIDKDKDGACDSCAYPVPIDPTPDPIEDKLLELTSKLTKQQVIYIAIGAVAVVILAIIIEISTLIHRRRKW